jgi:hypothetical protein
MNEHRLCLVAKVCEALPDTVRPGVSASNRKNSVPGVEFPPGKVGSGTDPIIGRRNDDLQVPGDSVQGSEGVFEEALPCDINESFGSGMTETFAASRGNNDDRNSHRSDA